MFLDCAQVLTIQESKSIIKLEWSPTRYSSSAHSHLNDLFISAVKPCIVFTCYGCFAATVANLSTFSKALKLTCRFPCKPIIHVLLMLTHLSLLATCLWLEYCRAWYSQLSASRFSKSTTGYTFTPCVGSFTSPGIDSR